jgi:hypothetical protein
MNFEDINIFGKKSLGDLFKDIYNNQKKTEQQISDMIMALKPFIQTASDATLIVPLIKEYMEVKVKNDEHLVKMAAIVQRAIGTSTKSNTSSDGDVTISEEEKNQLLETLNDMESQQKLIAEKIKEPNQE